MRFLNLHDWDLSPTDAVKLQRELAPQICQTKDTDIDRLRLIAGIDVSSSLDSPLLTAGIVVWDRDTGGIVEAAAAQKPSSFPYVPGLLSFREIPVILEALKELQVEPDAFLIDGHGRAHPRRLGIASHLGLMIERPTVGAAKSLLCGKHSELLLAKGSTAAIEDRGETIGMALRSKEGVKPVYVGVGNLIDLPRAVELVEICLRGYRLPEPTRLAHRHVHLIRTTGNGLSASHVERSLL